MPAAVTRTAASTITPLKRQRARVERQQIVANPHARNSPARVRPFRFFFTLISPQTSPTPEKEDDIKIVLCGSRDIVGATYL